MNNTPFSQVALPEIFKKYEYQSFSTIGYFDNNNNKPPSTKYLEKKEGIFEVKK